MYPPDLRWSSFSAICPPPPTLRPRPSYLRERGPGRVGPSPSSPATSCADDSCPRRPPSTFLCSEPPRRAGEDARPGRWNTRGPIQITGLPSYPDPDLFLSASPFRPLFSLYPRARAPLLSFLRSALVILLRLMAVYYLSHLSHSLSPPLSFSLFLSLVLLYNHVGTFLLLSLFDILSLSRPHTQSFPARPRA